MIILSETGTFMVIWNSLNILLCIVSSYYFIWLAAFEKESEREINSTGFFMIFEEVFFLVSMMLRFITDYTEEGENVPEKNLKVISKRYFYSWGFVLDLFP